MPFRHQLFKHIHALIVSAPKLHHFFDTRSAPPEKTRSTSTLVAI